jgi:hypothetical protein
MFSAPALARHHCSENCLWSVSDGSIISIVAGVLMAACAIMIPLALLPDRLDLSGGVNATSFSPPDTGTKRRVAAVSATLAALALPPWINYTNTYSCVSSEQIEYRNGIFFGKATISWDNLQSIEGDCGIAKGGFHWAHLVIHMVEPNKDIPLILHVPNPDLLHREVNFIRVKAEQSGAKFYRGSGVTQRLCAPEAYALFNRWTPD